LHRLKYRRDIGLGEALTPQLSLFVARMHWPIDLVLAVPLGRKRLKDRGYNQAALIAWPLAMAIGAEYGRGRLRRLRETVSQVGLTRLERRENVQGAFEANRRGVWRRCVLLIDDVATTGSTLSSCAEALYASGARDVFAVTVARAVRSSYA
jgi:competence protein ComFC